MTAGKKDQIVRQVARLTPANPSDPMNPGQSWRYRKARLRQILKIVNEEEEEAEGIALDEYLSKRPKSTSRTINVLAWRYLTMCLQQERVRI